MQASDKNGREESERDNAELLDQAIAEYLQAESAGKAGNRDEWLRRFPKCAIGLTEFFEDREHMDRLMLPARQQSPGGSSDSARSGDTPRIDYVEAPWNRGAKIAGGNDAEDVVHVDTIEFIPAAAQLSGDRYRQ